MPMNAAGAKPIARAMPRSRWDAGFIETARALLEECPAIIIKPNARLAGNGKGRLAADSAISTLNLINSANTPTSVPCAGVWPARPADALRNAPLSNAVASIAMMTATLAGQICAPAQ